MYLYDHSNMRNVITRFLLIVLYLQSTFLLNWQMFKYDRPLSIQADRPSKNNNLNQTFVYILICNVLNEIRYRLSVEFILFFCLWESGICFWYLSLNWIQCNLVFIRNGATSLSLRKTICILVRYQNCSPDLIRLKMISSNWRG